MLPMLLGQGAGLLHEMPAEEIDAALLFVAQACLAARSIEAMTPLQIVAVHEFEPGVDFDAIGRVAGPRHNED